MVIYRDILQGSKEWFAARLGCVTASEFHTVLAKGKGGAGSKTRFTYMLKLAGERLTGECAECYTNAHMERGKVMEEEARDLYCLLNEAEVDQVGFIKRDDDIGASPDGLVGKNGMLEIKTKLPYLQLAVLLSGSVPPEHFAQLQGNLWVAEREWIDFASYWPRLPLFVKRVYRDEEYIKRLSEGTEAFLSELSEIVSKVREM